MEPFFSADAETEATLCTIQRQQIARSRACNRRLEGPPLAPKAVSGDRVQDHPAVRDECYEQAQNDHHDDGPDLAVLDVYPNEH